MSEDIDEIYANSTVSYNHGQASINEFDIYYIHFGYERDSLRNLFPVLILSDNGEGVEQAENAVMDLLRNDDEFYIRSPGIYDPPVKEIEQVTCQIEFNRLSPTSNPDIIDGARPGDARTVFVELLEDLEQEQENLYYNSTSGSVPNHAIFWVDFEGSPEVRLPFPTEPPNGEIYTQHLDTEIPCYILTDDYDQRKLKRPVTLKWIYPIV
jgi:hypothetical protein